VCSVSSCNCMNCQLNGEINDLSSASGRALAIDSYQPARCLPCVFYKDDPRWLLKGCGSLYCAGLIQEGVDDAAKRSSLPHILSLRLTSARVHRTRVGHFRQASRPITGYSSGGKCVPNHK
jgi:hypothetical protein